MKIGGTGATDRLPAAYRWLIALGWRMAPPRRRATWRREWTGELWFALRSGRNRLGLLVRTTWCLIDAAWLWKGEMTVTMNGWFGDLRSALRSFVRAPGLTAIMVVTLALGIGANSAIFSIVDGVLLRDLPVENPDQLVWFSQEQPSRGITGWQYSYKQYRVLSENMRTVDLSVYSTNAFNVVGPDGPTRVAAARVSDTFFPILGQMPTLGRPFTRQEEAAGLNLTVISHKFWIEQMGSDSSAVGRVLTLDDQPYEVIGVLPRGANLIRQMNQVRGAPDDQTDIYVPLEAFGAVQGDFVSTLEMVGRLRVGAGATLEQARSEAEVIMTRLLEARGASGWFTAAVGLQESIVGASRLPLFILLGSVGVLLLMVCVNLSGLLLVRGVGRSGEWAVRRALGASQGQIVRQLLTEGGVVAVVGGLLGLGLAAWTVSFIRLNAPAGLPRVDELALDWRAVVFSLVLASLAAVLFELMPAVFATRRPPAAALTSSRQTLSNRGRLILKGSVALEVTLAVVLLTGSGVLLRSLNNLLQQDPGYSAAGVLRATTSLAPDRYPADENVARFTDQVMERLTGRPNVQSVAVSAMITPTGAPRNGFQKEDVPGDEGRGNALQNAVTPNYFETLDIALLDGRVFTEADGPNAPGVAVITKAMQDRYWPGESAVGKRVITGSWRHFMRTGLGTPPALREIVGVVEDLTAVGIDPGEPIHMFFSPFAQDPWAQHTYLIRTNGPPGALAPALRATVAEVDPNQPVYQVEALLDGQRAEIGRERLSALVLGAFAAVALLLSGLGIYGVVAYSVVMRRQEIGVRMAIGANEGSVAGLFFRDGLGPILLGVVAGLGIAFWSVQLLRGLLYEVSPADPIAFLGTGIALGFVAFASTYLPARRAARVDPVEALRPQ